MGGGGGGGRAGGHRHTEGQFCSLGDSGRGSWVVSSECLNYALHKTTMQRQAAERTRPDKRLADSGRDCWCARPQPIPPPPPTPCSSAWAPPEELWQILEMLVSRGDRTPPHSPGDVGFTVFPLSSFQYPRPSPRPPSPPVDSDGA